jgi:hypothetical protein
MVVVGRNPVLVKLIGRVCYESNTSYILGHKVVKSLERLMG